jgi:hypothetical protein
VTSASLHRRRTIGLALLVTVGSPAAQAQFFSPGPLAKAHAALDGRGLDKCAACHDQAEPHFANRCLVCHTELEPELKQHTGLHGRLAAAAVNQCQTCHPDHRGRDFSLINFGASIKGFDHQSTGWKLRGRHAQVSCQSCHDDHQLVDSAITRMLAAEAGRTTYLGLTTRCDSCHFDEHRGQLGTACQKCHGESAWFWTTAADSFDHGKTSFPLLGKHQPVPCTGCHPSVDDRASFKQMFPQPRNPTFLQMKPIQHGSCESCHTDPHQGSFGPTCTSCHSEAGWDQILASRNLGASFHDRTRFPLLGAHAHVDCKSCHGPFSRRKPAIFRGLPFDKCSDCHQDAHVGQLAAAPGRAAADCASCHDVQGFSPPRFELEAHAQTNFPLQGAHQATACRDCHPIDKSLETRVPEAVRARLARQHRPVVVSLAVLRPKLAADQCSRCHPDPHQGQFQTEIGKDDCGGCHSLRSWDDLAFDHDSDSRFPLTGAHRSAPCAACHRTEQVLAKEAPVPRWKPLPISCGGCHRDQHQGQFLASQARSGDPRPVTEDCSFCHQTTSFKATQFSHADSRFTTFALEGKHATLPCGDCHRPVILGAAGRTIQTIRYRPVPRTCEACHVDFHHGDFQGFAP